jgi:LysR family transcriptional regulator, nod-box dependent transcriptional activator
MRRFDLNLLYTMRALLRTPSTTRVAEQLGVTQSAVSAALVRLRHVFGDELLVRSGRSMQLTRRAEELSAPLEEIFSKLDALVTEVAFEPQKLQRNFVLASAEYLLAGIMPPLMGALQKQAQGVSLSCEIASDQMIERVQTGRVDLALVPTGLLRRSKTPLSMTPIYTDRLVGVAARGNKKIKGGVSVEEYLSMRHIAYRASSAGSGPSSAVDKFMEASNLQLDIALEVSSFAIIPSALAGTEMVTTIPSRILSFIPERKNLLTFEVPFENPEFEVSMAWSPLADNDVEHRWFRDLVQEQMQAVFIQK